MRISCSDSGSTRHNDSGSIALPAELAVELARRFVVAKPALALFLTAVSVISWRECLSVAPWLTLAQHGFPLLGMKTAARFWGSRAWSTAAARASVLQTRS